MFFVSCYQGQRAKQLFLGSHMALVCRYASPKPNNKNEEKPMKNNHIKWPMPPNQPSQNKAWRCFLAYGFPYFCQPNGVYLRLIFPISKVWKLSKKFPPSRIRRHHLALQFVDVLLKRSHTELHQQRSE